FNSVTNEIKINSQNESQIRITYQTPDLVNKQEREWSFLINSAFPFTVKLPNDAVVTNLGEQSPSLIRKLGGQNLLSFDKGRVSIDYVIGYAGTREQAIISINSAELDLAKAESEHTGINLGDVKDILHNAKTALNQSNFIDAERLANNASDLSGIITESFEISKDTMNNATRKIEALQGMNVDTSQASGFVSKSNIEFSQGNYPKALEYATLALNSLEPPRQEQLFLNSSSTVYLLLIPLAVSVGFFMMRKYRRKFNPHIQSSSIKIDPLKSDTSTNTFKENNFIEKQSPIKEQTGNESPTDSDLHNLVTDIITQKGNLKPEEKEILFYISEKEGAAFEGEIRNKFILPKTSLWRLLKRLERENLIEVTKIGGQNLIKLRLQK
ncbi:MAG: helix-turn-helix transcriptional regulator, partial [Nitrososphaeraceae archaeon]